MGCRWRCRAAPMPPREAIDHAKWDTADHTRPSGKRQRYPEHSNHQKNASGGSVVPLRSTASRRMARQEPGVSEAPAAVTRLSSARTYKPTMRTFDAGQARSSCSTRHGLASESNQSLRARDSAVTRLLVKGSSRREEIGSSVPTDPEPRLR